MRLDKESFIQLIRDPLIDEVSSRRGRRMVDEGAVWVDVRHRDQFARGSFADVRNIPRAVLRAECRKLVKGRRYIVCGEDQGDSAVCAFLLAERGFDVSYIAEPMSKLLASEESEMHRAERTSVVPESGTVVPFPPQGDEDASSEQQQTLIESAMQAEEAAKARDAAVVDMEEGYGPSAPAPRQDYADTVTGERLANLVDEINDRYRDLTSDSDNTLTGDTLIEGVLDVSTLDQEEMPAPPPEEPEDVPTQEPEEPMDIRRLELSIPEEEISQIMQEMELKLRRSLIAFASAQRIQYEEQLHKRTEQLKQVATRELQKKALEIRRAYRSKYEAKEQALRRHYQRLMRLANKITRQKVEIRNARRELEEKLKATDNLYREVDEVRRLLKQRIGNLDGLESDDDSNQSAS